MSLHTYRCRGIFIVPFTAVTKVTDPFKGNVYNHYHYAMHNKQRG